ncbi:MAG: ribosome biogenesis GTPase Der [Gemmatimonadota bacterium]
MSRRLPVVAVVGRPNVGKSTFFNRVLGRREAIVDDFPGVTRDRNFSQADWAGQGFYLVDTGGVVEDSDEPMERAVRAQALAAVEEADLILFVVDGSVGVHPLDEKLGAVLRRSGRPVLLVVNKMDNLPVDKGHLDFWTLGMGDPLPVSAISGKGSGDLLDRIVALLPQREPHDQEDEIRVAVIGKPNVGKSSFVNRLLGEERMVVNDMPGTTRDAVDTPFAYHGKTLIFVDTAGLRRQARIEPGLEYYSSLRTARVIQEAHVAILLVDGSDGVHVQDIKVAEQAWDAGCGLILCVNKWDLVEKDEKTAPDLERDLRRRAPHFQWIPTLFTSALTGQRVRHVLDRILAVAEERNRRIPTHEVNEVLRDLVNRQHPPHARGREVKLRYGTQVGVAPPSFLVFANLPKDVPDHYLRYLHNGFRQAWGFQGSPLRIRIKSTPRRELPPT